VPPPYASSNDIIFISQSRFLYDLQMNILISVAAPRRAARNVNANAEIKDQ
jgi:hypothetical protein